MSVNDRGLHDSLSLGSDIWIANPCSSCSKEGKNVQAIKHCVECGENLCTQCLSYHEKFTRGHQILDTLRHQTGQTRAELPVQRCEKHGGKLVDEYCRGHDAVGCASCMNVDHSACKGIQYISDIPHGSQTCEQMSKLETMLNELLLQLGQLKSKKQDNLKQLPTKKDDLLTEITDLRKKVNDKLDEMEKVLVDDIDKTFNMKSQDVNESIDKISHVESAIATRQKALNDAKMINDAELFVQLKMGMASVQEAEKTLKYVGSVHANMATKFVPNNDIVNMLADDNISLGRISEMFFPKSVTHSHDISVRMCSDKSKCDIGDACLTTNGSVIITDFKNKRIKKFFLDDMFAFIEHLDMKDAPHDICEVDCTQIAITLINHKKVQFVFQQPLKMGTSFSVSDNCRGIDCRDGLLYVCCGGRADQGEGPGHIEVYAMNGDLLRSYYHGLKRPNRIKVSDRNELFVSDYDRDTVININMHSYNVSQIQTKKLARPIGLCRIGDGQLCIAGFESNNIVLISEDGEHQQELLGEKDGLVKPVNVCYDEKQSRLLVFRSESEMIQVFNVVM